MMVEGSICLRKKSKKSKVWCPVSPVSPCAAAVDPATPPPVFRGRENRDRHDISYFSGASFMVLGQVLTVCAGGFRPPAFSEDGGAGGASSAAAVHPIRNTILRP
jgi:hypothetical protein